MREEDEVRVVTFHFHVHSSISFLVSLGESHTLLALNNTLSLISIPLLSDLS